MDKEDYRRKSAFLRGISLGLGIKYQDIEDCTQECLMKYIEKGSPPNYIWRYSVIDFLRKISGRKGYSNYKNNSPDLFHEQEYEMACLDYKNWINSLYTTKNDLSLKKLRIALDNNLLSDNQISCISLKLNKGYLNEKIGKSIGVKQSRVSQIFIEIRKVLNGLEI